MNSSSYAEPTEDRLPNFSTETDEGEQPVAKRLPNFGQRLPNFHRARTAEDFQAGFEDQGAAIAAGKAGYPSEKQQLEAEQGRLRKEGPAPVLASSPKTLGKLWDSAVGNLFGAALKGVAAIPTPGGPTGTEALPQSDRPLELTAVQKRQEVTDGHLYRMGDWIQRKSAGILESVPEREKGTVTAQLADSLASLTPAATGPAAPVVFGLLKTGESYDTAYNDALGAGKTKEEAAHKAADTALLSGVNCITLGKPTY